MLDRSMQYGLDMDNLPTLTLLDGTKVDLNSPEILNRIQNLPEGQSFTIGRSGDVRLANAGDTVSGHHILITRHNGRIIMKDISRNGRTVVRSSIRNSNVNSKYNISYDMNLNGFRRNPNAQTNVKGIKPNEVQVGGNYTGYSSFTSSIYKNVDADLRNGFLTSNANSFVAYNVANNVTSIGIKTSDAYGRPGIFNITIKGQVSENDAVNLLVYLESKNLLPTGKSNSYSMEDVDARYLQSIARRIQEEVATFFS